MVTQQIAEREAEIDRGRREEDEDRGSEVIPIYESHGILVSDGVGDAYKTYRTYRTYNAYRTYRTYETYIPISIINRFIFSLIHSLILTIDVSRYCLPGQQMDNRSDP